MSTLLRMAWVTRIVLLATCAVALTSCSDDASKRSSSTKKPQTTGTSASVPSSGAPGAGQPAAAGGACALLDFAMVEASVGTKFAVATPHKAGNVSSCVLDSRDVAFPEVSLTVAPTAADATIFKETVMPDDAKAVSGLGKAAYQLSRKPADGTGPASEIGWLAEGKLVSLRYTHAPGTPQAQAAALNPKTLALAKKIDPALKAFKT